MELNKRKVGDVTIFDLDGKLTIGRGDVILREALREEFESGGKSVLINLDDVKTIDSSARPKSSSSTSTSRRANC